MNNELYKKWNNRWADNDEKNLTFVGKLMLKSKQAALKNVLKKINPKSAIDVGCALGYTLSVFQDLNIKTLGIDISKNAIEICKKKELNAIQKRLEDVEEKFEFVFSDGMLEHFLNFEPIAKNLMDISSKYVCITQTDHGSFTGKTSIYLAEILRGGKNVLEYNYRIEDFIYIFKKNNFKLIKNQNLFNGIFKILLFKK
ncbi:methyltransferase domain-containing protein [Candidatus Parcubacteria bacterium]|nr:methyltransferase domain-containing protein [Candidatus Parcubacteria bacterium]